MLIVGGIWGAIVGITAIAEDEFFVVTPDWVFQFGATAWGWTHLIVGVAFVASGIGIFSGNVLARSPAELVTAASELDTGDEVIVLTHRPHAVVGFPQ